MKQWYALYVSLYSHWSYRYNSFCILFWILLMWKPSKIFMIFKLFFGQILWRARNKWKFLTFYLKCVISRKILEVSKIWRTVFCCRIWSWSPVPCEKHDPRDSVDKNRCFCRYWGPWAMFFTRNGRPWSNPIISRSLIDFFPCFIHINMNFSALKWAIFGSHHGC